MLGVAVLGGLVLASYPIYVPVPPPPYVQPIELVGVFVEWEWMEGKFPEYNTGRAEFAACERMSGGFREREGMRGEFADFDRLGGR